MIFQHIEEIFLKMSAILSHLWRNVYLKMQWNVTVREVWTQLFICYLAESIWPELKLPRKGSDFFHLCFPVFSLSCSPWLSCSCHARHDNVPHRPGLALQLLFLVLHGGGECVWKAVCCHWGVPPLMAHSPMYPLEQVIKLATSRPL